ncbi:MAG: ABC transporter ATP-binding protein [Spirochaetes bacterium]|uniref:ABC transporter ATP-binding protein n=1 Tax=Candidatus Ornithospirochaeta stercoripullorum TaxID=2840899 RepID=A0A9D9H5X4_9SPIO|nr:ABC transporter ATP-binding protein [Candidatus Ornithospirochaeta stercoripullorum]
MKNLRRLFALFGPYKSSAIIACILVAVETSFELIIPTMMADLIDIGVANNDVRYMLFKGGEMAFCALLALATGLTYARFAARAAYGWGARIREKEYEKLQQYAFSNIDKFETSSLVTRLTSDITVMQNTINNGLRPLVRAPVMLVLGIIFSFSMNAELALVFIILTPLLGLVLFAIVRHVAPMYSVLQKTVDNLNGVVEENLRAIRTVKAFVRGEYEEAKFDNVNETLSSVATKTNRTAVLNLPFFQTAMYICVLCLMFFGGSMVLAGTLQVGELTGFLSYVMQVLNSMMMLSNVFLLLTRSLASAMRIGTVLDEEPSLSERDDALHDVPSSSVEFRNVSFSYSAKAREKTLSDINLTIPAGSTVGILGGTGSGKTTLVQLIDRLYDVGEGEVLVGGIDVRNYSLQVLRDAIGMVLQKNLLFSGTIRENLQWGDKNASDDEIWKACDIAGASEFIHRFPAGLDTDLGQGGVNVSGGQKQRLCIARALLKKPKVLIFDDSTSAVDSATERCIREGLQKLEGVTKIFIAQRISTVMEADCIFILDNGHLVASGSHEELLKTSQIYREIYDSQMKGGTF